MKKTMVIDEFGRKVEVDESARKLYSYNNKRKQIVYNAPIIERGVVTDFWVNYTVRGTVDSIEDRLEKWNNKLLLIYSANVGFRASVNDPGKRIYRKFVKFIKENEDKFFTKDGDFRKRFLIGEDDIVEVLN